VTKSAFAIGFAAGGGHSEGQKSHPAKGKRLFSKKPGIFYGLMYPTW
jgi:hypothetical protein